MIKDNSQRVDVRVVSQVLNKRRKPFFLNGPLQIGPTRDKSTATNLDARKVGRVSVCVLKCNTLLGVCNTGLDDNNYDNDGGNNYTNQHVEAVV